MISDIFKPAVVRLISPTARGLLRIGLTPNSVTTIGAIGVIATSLIAYPNGHLFGGTVAICCLALRIYSMARWLDYPPKDRADGAGF